MQLPSLGSLTSLPVHDHLDLLGPSVAAALSRWSYADELAVVEIEQDLADTAAFTTAYALPLEASANCVVVAGRRDGAERVAACLVAAHTRADVNGLAKRTLDVRKCSFLPTDRAVAETDMEYGGITPIGLPTGWRIFVDARLLGIDVAILGSGTRRSKLLMSGPRLADLPGVEVIDGLGI